MDTLASIRGLDRVLKQLVNPHAPEPGAAASTGLAAALRGPQHVPGAPSAAILQRAAIVDAMLRRLNAKARPAPRRTGLPVFDPA